MVSGVKYNEHNYTFCENELFEDHTLNWQLLCGIKYFGTTNIFLLEILTCTMYLRRYSVL